MFYIITLSFIIGILLRSIFSFDVFYGFVLVLIAIAVYVIIRHQSVKLFGLGAVFLFIGILRFDAAEFDAGAAGPGQIAYYYDQTIEFSGTVVDEPDIRNDQIKYIVSRIIYDNHQIQGKVLITLSLYPQFQIADQVRLSCRIVRPKAIEDFAYDKYLARKGIYALCYYPELIAQDDIDSHIPIWLKIKKQLFQLKNTIIVQFKKLLPHPHSALMSGILLGDTTGMPDYLDQAFVDTGTIHIVAMSGYNITIIVKLFIIVAPWIYLSRRNAWFLIVPSLVGFVIIAGGEASIVRSALMAVIAAMATESGRQSRVDRLLLVTAVVMLAINPYLLRYDVGFQLSFLATIGLVYIVPVMERGINWLYGKCYLESRRKSKGRISAVAINSRQRFFAEFIRRIGGLGTTLANIAQTIRESAVTTISANIAVAPILLFQFGRVSFISPLVNVLILWCIPLIMALGFVAVMASFIIYPLGQMLAWITWLWLEYVIEVVKFF